MGGKTKERKKETTDNKGEIYNFKSFGKNLLHGLCLE